MEEWITTTGVIFVIVALALAIIAIGWMLTGKSKLIRNCDEKVPRPLKGDDQK